MKKSKLERLAADFEPGDVVDVKTCCDGKRAYGRYYFDGRSKVHPDHQYILRFVRHDCMTRTRTPFIVFFQYKHVCEIVLVSASDL